MPSVVYCIADYAELGIDGVSIGSSDLTQLSSRGSLAGRFAD
ncbi:MAG: hypothetical protein WCC60_01205 [Ilumatobacteraceae bacterium]